MYFIRGSLTGLLFVVVLGFLSGCRDTTVQSPDQVFLEASWNTYKQVFIKPEGYVWDQLRGEVTSEGQSYALLRAAWMHDQDTFDRVFAWTEAHLRREDGLFSWQWTPKDGGRVNDSNTATDADQDIAFSLILASRTFHSTVYLDRARSLLKAIRQHEGIIVPGGWIPCAGNWAVSERIINFSYFTFYAYPDFASLDPEGDWLGVRERCYNVLVHFLNRPKVVLPADFSIIDEEGSFYPVSGKGQLSDDFSFDAMRVYWRIAVDCLRNHNLRACSDPAKVQNIIEIISRDGDLCIKYSVFGEKKNDTTSVSFYGSILPSIGIINTKLAGTIVEKKLSHKEMLYLLQDSKRYYDNNWAWFGLAAWMESSITE